MDLEWLKGNVFPFINFALFVFLLIKFAKKPILSGLQQRRADYITSKDAAETAFKQAEAAQHRAQEQLANIPKETQAIIDNAVKAAQQEAEMIIKKAEAHAKQIIEDAHGRISAETLELTTAAKKQIIEGALNLAREQIRTQLTEQPSMGAELFNTGKGSLVNIQFEDMRS